MTTMTDVTRIQDCLICGNGFRVRGEKGVECAACMATAVAEKERDDRTNLLRDECKRRAQAEAKLAESERERDEYREVAVVQRRGIHALTAERDEARKEADGYKAAWRDAVDYQSTRIVESERAAAAMRSALVAQDPRKAADRYVRIAADFERATGLIAPGQSVPAALQQSRHDQDRAEKAWRPFVNEWHERFFDAALSSTAGRGWASPDAVRTVREALEQGADAFRVTKHQSLADRLYAALDALPKEEP